MSARAMYTESTISDIAASIAASPAPERPMSKMDALAKLAPELKAAHQRGHSLDDLVQLLAAKGMETHTRAIARVLRDHDSASGKKRERKPRNVSKHPAGEDAKHRVQLEAAGQHRLQA